MLIIYLYRLHEGKHPDEYLRWFRQVQQEQLRAYDCVRQVQVVPVEPLDERIGGFQFLELIEVSSRQDWLRQVETPEEQEALRRWEAWGDLETTLSLVEGAPQGRWAGAPNSPAAPTHA